MFRTFRGRAIEFLIIANALMFLLSFALPDMARSLALTPAFVLSRPWTLLTSMFLHSGLEHIFLNMLFGVFMFGQYLQRLIGEREFLKVYFAGGIAAGLFYVAMSLALNIPPPYSSAVGASGAVFAVIGALVVLRPNMELYVYFLFPVKLWVFALLYLAYSVVAIPTMMGGGTAITAHVGGLLAGLIMGKMYMNKVYEPPQYTYVRYY
jgi:uncharacterized protein